MTKNNYLVMLLIIIVLVLVSACAPAATPTPAPPFRVALILPGRMDDVSWNQAAYEGVQWLAEQMGEEMEWVYVENVYDVADIEPALRDYAEKGYDLVIGHGFQFQEPIITVAPEFPDVYFALGTGFKTAPNVSVYDVKLEEGGYVMGIIAGMLTESDIVGVIGGVDVSEIHRGHEAFKLGVASVNPDARVLETYIGDWNDLAAAREAAMSHIDAGSDIIWHSGDGIGLAIVEAAADRDILVMGNVCDQHSVAPDHVLTGNVYAWGPIFLEMVQDIKAGEYGEEHYWLTFANKGIELAPYYDLASVITPEIQSAIDEAVNGFIEGTLTLPELD